MNDIKLWSNGTIKMPFMNIPVLDIRKCLPDMWKAVACSLQIKPCHIKSRGSVICKYGASACTYSNAEKTHFWVTSVIMCPQVRLCGHTDPVWRQETLP